MVQHTPSRERPNCSYPRHYPTKCLLTSSTHLRTSLTQSTLSLPQGPRKLWKSGTVGGHRVEKSGRGFPVLVVGGCYPREIFRKYRCKSVQFGALWGHQVIKSGTENIHISAPLVKVGRNLPFLPYRFRGPCFTYSMSKLCQSALLVTKLTDSNPNSSLSCAFIILSLQHIHLILLISVLSNFAACATSVG